MREHFRFHRPQEHSMAERRLIEKLEQPKKFVTGERGIEKGGGVREQKGRTFEYTQEQFQNFFENEIKRVVGGMRRHEVRKRVSEDWGGERARYRRDYAFEGRDRREHRGEYMKRWKAHHYDLMDYRDSYVANRRGQVEKEVDRTGRYRGNIEDLLGNQMVIDQLLDGITNEIFDNPPVSGPGTARFEEAYQRAWELLGERLINLDPAYGEENIPPELQHMWREGKLAAPGAYLHGKYLGRRRVKHFHGEKRTDEDYMYADRAEELKTEGEFLTYDSFFPHKYDGVEGYDVNDSDTHPLSLRLAQHFNYLSGDASGWGNEEALDATSAVMSDRFEYRLLREDDPLDDRPAIVEFHRKAPTARELRKAKKKEEVREKRGLIFMEEGEVLIAFDFGEIDEMLDDSLLFHGENGGVGHLALFGTEQQEAIKSSRLTLKENRDYEFYINTGEYLKGALEMYRQYKAIHRNVDEWSNGRDLKQFDEAGWDSPGRPNRSRKKRDFDRIKFAEEVQEFSDNADDPVRNMLDTYLSIKLGNAVSGTGEERGASDAGQKYEEVVNQYL